MFVDASALVAILVREPGWEDLAGALDAAAQPITSAITVYETVLAVARLRDGDIEAARADVRAFLHAADMAVVPIETDDADAAVTAFARFGKGRGHPARLNLGDCFAYALARRHGVSLLFKGDDFSKTDLGDATP